MSNNKTAIIGIYRERNGGIKVSLVTQEWRGRLENFLRDARNLAEKVMIFKSSGIAGKPIAWISSTDNAAMGEFTDRIFDHLSSYISDNGFNPVMADEKEIAEEARTVLALNQDEYQLVLTLLKIELDKHRPFAEISAEGPCNEVTLPGECPNCQSVIDSNKSFCPDCGHDLKTASKVEALAIKIADRLDKITLERRKSLEEEAKALSELQELSSSLRTGTFLNGFKIKLN